MNRVILVLLHQKTKKETEICYKKTEKSIIKYKLYNIIRYYVRNKI